MKKLLYLFLLFFVVGCGSTSKLSGVTSLVQNPWVLNSLGDATDLTSLFGDKIPSLNFGSDGSITGTDGCNNLTGKVGADLLSTGKLDFTKMASTKMACPNTQEGSNKFNQMLSNVTNFSIDNNVLSLLDGKGKNLASFIPKK